MSFDGIKKVSSVQCPVSSEEAGGGSCAQRILVIGYGNPLRSDDGVGPAIVRSLDESLHDAARLTCLAAFQLTPELADDISRTDCVYFVDASVAIPPGDITVSRVVASVRRQGALGHEMSPEELMALSQIMQGPDAATPEAWAIGIGVCSLEYGQSLTAPVARAAGRIVEFLSSRFSNLSADAGVGGSCNNFSPGAKHSGAFNPFI